MTDNKARGTIFNIQKFSIHDGEGIRTLIFMKGCPLRCIWCSNPESQKPFLEVMDVKSNCVACGKCVKLCRKNAVDPVTFNIDRNLCDKCGICAEYCYANAKKLTGKQVTVDELKSIIEKDRIFYTNSGGGVTIGGGEPVMQYEFVTELLKECHKSNIHTAIETCGYGIWADICSIFDYLDEVFFDLKHMDNKMHRKLTGVDNYFILENAAHIARLNKDITFRLPLIPGCNDTEDNIIRTGKFVAELTDKNPQIKIELLPYHALGADKYKWMDIPYKLEEIRTPDSQTVEHYNRMLERLGCTVVR